MSEPEREALTVIREPYSSEGRSSTTAGVGVGRANIGPGGVTVTVEQLWEARGTDPVHIEPEDVPAVIEALEEAYEEVTGDAD